MRMLLAVLCALVVLMNGAAWAQADKHIIITFKSGTSAEARNKALEDLNAKGLGSILSSGNSDDEFVAEVAEVSGDVAVTPVSSVLKIEEDYNIKWIEDAPVGFQAAPFPNGPLSRLGLEKFKPSSLIKISATRSEIPWGVARLKAPAAWEYTQGAGVRVAVIDTGIDTGHSDLHGQVDGGFSAIANSESSESYVDDNGHGTHVAGTIGAIRNEKGVVGVAPRARLYAVKVLDADGSGTLSDVIKGIIWCANNGMQVANMSLGSPLPSDTMQRALRYAKARGVIIVAAAGNSSGGAVSYPGAYPETIAVSASDWKDRLAVFSSRGPEVKFIAPGVAVVSTMLGGDYANYSGTSMAAPHVAGLAAFTVSQGYRGLDGPDGVMAQLQKAARPLAGLQQQDQGFGIIDAERLVR